MKYAEKHGVPRTIRSRNTIKQSRPYIPFWRRRFDGTFESLTRRSRRPLRYPNQRTAAETKLIQKMRRTNPELGIIELWAWLKSRGYTRCVESLWRVLRRKSCRRGNAQKKYTPKPYEQLQYPGQRVQIDVKVVPPQVYRRPETKVVSVYGNRRISTLPGFGNFCSLNAFGGQQFSSHASASLAFSSSASSLFPCSICLTDPYP